MTSSARIEDLHRKYEENPGRYFAPLADELRRAGDARRAVTLCESHLAAAPDHLSGHVVLGQSLADLGDRTGAERALLRALELDPENVVALRVMGDLARGDADREAARGWYQRALEVDPRDPELATRMATLDSVIPVDPTLAEPPAADSAPGPWAPPAPDAMLADTGGAPEDPTAMAGEEPVQDRRDSDMDREFSEQQTAADFTAGFFAAVLREERASFEGGAAAADGFATDAGGEGTPDPDAAAGGADAVFPGVHGGTTAPAGPAQPSVAAPSPAAPEVADYPRPPVHDEAELMQQLAELEADLEREVGEEHAAGDGGAAHPGAELDEPPTGGDASPLADDDAELLFDDLPAIDVGLIAVGVTDAVDGDPGRAEPHDGLAVADAEAVPPTGDLRGADAEAVPLSDSSPGTEPDAVPPAAEPVVEAAEIVTGADEGHAEPLHSSRPPFVTVTMAELLVRQGFHADALAVYRQLGELHPDDEDIAGRIAELDARLAATEATGAGEPTVSDWLRGLAAAEPVTSTNGIRSSGIPRSVDEGDAAGGGVDGYGTEEGGAVMGETGGLPEVEEAAPAFWVEAAPDSYAAPEVGGIGGVRDEPRARDMGEPAGIGRAATGDGDAGVSAATSPHAEGGEAEGGVADVPYVAADARRSATPPAGDPLGEAAAASAALEALSSGGWALVEGPVEEEDGSAAGSMPPEVPTGSSRDALTWDDIWGEHHPQVEAGAVRGDEYPGERVDESSGVPADAPAIGEDRGLSLDALGAGPASAEDEAAAGALAAVTLAMQNDDEVDRQLAEAAAEDPDGLAMLLGRDAPDSGGPAATVSGGFSFEQFFTPAATGTDASGDRAGGGAHRAAVDGGQLDEQAAAREADLAEFNDWLSRLSEQ